MEKVKPEVEDVATRDDTDPALLSFFEQVFDNEASLRVKILYTEGFNLLLAYILFVVTWSIQRSWADARLLDPNYMMIQTIFFLNWYIAVKVFSLQY